MPVEPDRSAGVQINAGPKEIHPYFRLPWSLILQRIAIEKIIAGWSGLEKRFLPAYVWNSDPLTFWRERILFFICFLSAVLGPFALIPSLWIAYRERLWNVIVLDVVAYITAVIIIIGREWSLQIRTGVIALVLYILGVCLLFFLGPVGAGYIWLFSASVIR